MGQFHQTGRIQKARWMVGTPHFLMLLGKYRGKTAMMQQLRDFCIADFHPHILLASPIRTMGLLKAVLGPA